MHILRNPIVSIAISVLLAFAALLGLGELRVPVKAPAMVLLLAMAGWHLLIWLPVIAKRFSLRTLLVFMMLIAVYLGGVQSAGIWSALASGLYRHRANTAGRQVFQYDVWSDGSLSPGEFVNVVLETQPGIPTLVASGAIVIKIADGPGRSTAVFALDRREAQKLMTSGYRTNYRLVRAD